MHQSKLQALIDTKFCIYHDCRDHFVHAPSQEETTLQCNVVSYWLRHTRNDPCCGTCKICGNVIQKNHDVQFTCAIYQPLLAHHWRVHQCLLTSCFIAPSIPWGVSAPGGKMWKQLLKDRNFLNNSPIFTIEISTIIHLLFKKHCIQYISI